MQEAGLDEVIDELLVLDGLFPYRHPATVLEQHCQSIKVGCRSITALTKLNQEGNPVY